MRSRVCRCLRETVRLDVDFEVGNDDKRRHDQTRHEHTCNHRGKVVQHFLQSEEIPGRLRRIRGMRRVRKPFKRSIEQQRDPHQRDGERHDGNGRAEEHFRKSLQLIFGLSLDLCRGAASNEDDAARRFLRVRVHAGGEVFGVSHDYCPSFMVAAAWARTVAGSLECE